MSPIRSLTEYLDTVRKEITRVEDGLQKPEYTPGKDRFQKPEYAQLIELSKEYINLLKEVETQYQSNDLCPLLEEAYRQLDIYLNTYLGLLTPENAARFNRNDPKIILYVGPEAAFRRFPLAKKYLLAIRKSDISQAPPVWTSLAHELGHFIYWNSEFPAPDEPETIEPQIAQINNTLFLDEIWKSFGVSLEELPSLSSESKSLDSRQQTVVLAALMTAWSEEIFADTVGVFLSGEEYFTQSKHFYLSGLMPDQESRLSMDVDHPSPLLRPYIAAKALENKTGMPNNLWRIFKYEIKTEYQKNFLAEIGGQPDSSITDNDLALTIPLNNGLSVEIDFETLKSVIIVTIGLLAKKIRSSIPMERPSSSEFIEEFADEQFFIKNIIQGTIRALAAIFKRSIIGPGHHHG